MSFSEETIQEAWLRSGGRCECKRPTHTHGERCNKILDKENRGCASGDYGSWEYHHTIHVESGGSDALSNCEILCCECHEATL